MLSLYTHFNVDIFYMSSFPSPAERDQAPAQCGVWEFEGPLASLRDTQPVKCVAEGQSTVSKLFTSRRHQHFLTFLSPQFHTQFTCIPILDFSFGISHFSFFIPFVFLLTMRCLTVLALESLSKLPSPKFSKFE